MDLKKLMNRSLDDMNHAELNQVIELCIGRLFRLGSRPYQDGDIETYEDIKDIALEANDLINQ